MSSSSSSDSRTLKSVCFHGDEAVIFTSNTDLNPCRRFRRCRNIQNACTYFSWVDPELGPFQKSCFLKLKAEKALLEEQLKCRDVTEVALVERLKMKEDELLYLKSKVNELEEQVQVLSKRNRFRYPIVCVSVVLFVVLLLFFGKEENG
ncbi:Unknown protein [Striga hermonthica]|uniref:GRF-type domain-containing protein n=1 Tax=Striga hermonthica TaxID=68872 RepID=A0A9N7N0W9_STRHE|nr:Unknown protein [Striga hermonthica]